MPFTDLLPLADEGTLFAYLRQVQLLRLLEDRLGPHTWVLEPEALRFTSVEAGREVVVPVRRVARVDALGLGWDAASADLATYGEVEGVPSLTVDLHWTEPASGLQVIGLAHRVGNAAVAALGAGPYYCVPDRDGVVVVIAHASLPTLHIDDETLAAVSRVIVAGDLVDERAALTGLARLAGWELDLAETGERCSVVVRHPGDALELTAEFDAGCRLTRAGVLSAV